MRLKKTDANLRDSLVTQNLDIDLASTCALFNFNSCWTKILFFLPHRESVDAVLIERIL